MNRSNHRWCVDRWGGSLPAACGARLGVLALDAPELAWGFRQSLRRGPMIRGDGGGVRRFPPRTDRGSPAGLLPAAGLGIGTSPLALAAPLEARVAGGVG